MLPPKHPDEARRLKALHGYDVLDTGAEADFDDIVALASAICEVPVSLISLVDGDRQWFKAAKGFDLPETPLEQSVCAHAIMGDGILEIPDMSLDPRTRDNTLHTGGPRVQYYAGANLIAPGGLPIGTLCVLDTKPRQLTQFQREALRALSKQVITQLELRKKLRQETEMRAEIDHRVSNSLQTISSLLRLSARKVQDEDALGVLKFVERRLSAVASLHGELMGRDGQGTVDAAGYLDRVASFLREICPPSVRLDVESADIDVASGQASALGMIASEFVANSIKYAFPGGRAGAVSISLQPSGANHLEFRCADDGVGRKARVTDADRGSGLGAKLIASAARQLDGDLDHEVGADGTTLQVRFARR